MSRSKGLLRAYAALVRSVSGADSVCLYTPASAEAPAFLLREGEPPVPELETLEAAARFVSAREWELDSSGTTRPLSSSHEPSWLFATPCSPFTQSPTRRNERRRTASTRKERADDAPLFCWIALGFESSPAGRAQASEAYGRLTGAPPPEDDPHSGSLLGLGGVLAWYARQISSILDDPVTGLAGRAEFQASLSRGLSEARGAVRPLALLLMNPDDFTSVNERFGHESGDEVLREIGARLRTAHRSSDTIAKYGGAIFASFLADTDLSAARVVAEKVWTSLTHRPYLDETVRLPISIGLAVYEPGDETLEGHLELIRRADKALNAAKRYGGDHVVAWEPELDSKELGSVDRMTGVYTGNMAKDYRNMTLLSDTMTVVAGSDETDALVQQVVDRLYHTLKADHVGLFEWRDGDEPVLLGGLTKHATDEGGAAPVPGLELPRSRGALLEDARREERAMVASFSDDFSDKQVLSFVVPLLLNERCLGAIYLDGRTDTLALEGSADLGFLRAFATQLAVALDRARLNERQKERSEREQIRLRDELNDLRAALSQSRLVYRSGEMEAVMDTVRRVAPTKATVLVIGESGTGKELVARTIHELSPFRRKPIVVVDCGAIPTTLIESELFGHERGAYTGAQERRIGRLLEAEGGTVVLDEIGELPLEVQSKLLRFVQERQVVPVGGTRVHRVDTRLVAVTNRELAVEAAAGRFREDLYYRLDVVRITVPPLRDRREDVLCLAEHFLEQFAGQYEKDGLRFSSEAKELMAEHEWPGNIRELQNRILQAVILTEGTEIGARELELEAPEPAPTAREQPARSNGGRSSTGPDVPAPRSIGSEPFASPDEGWGALRASLGDQIEEATRDPEAEALPIGTWLAEDLVLAAYDAADGVAGRARALLGVAETTFRRKLTKVLSGRRAGLLARHASWYGVPPLLERLVRTPGIAASDALQTARHLLLEEVLDRVEGPLRGAALMGVTVRTYRRWIEGRSDASPSTSVASSSPH